MSVTAISWAYEQRIPQPGAKFVLVTLANFADGDGFCYPGQGRLAHKTGIKERTVRAHLAYLENDLQLIKREHRRGENGKWTSDGYLLQVPADVLNSAKSDGRQNLPLAISAVGKKQPVAKSAANTKEHNDDPKDKPYEAHPSASPQAGVNEVATKFAHREGMELIRARCGPIPDPAAQGAALKWLLIHYTLEQCRVCLDAMLEDSWRKTRVSWLTVKKEIGSWIARKENNDAGNGRPQGSGGRDQTATGGCTTTRRGRRIAELKRQDPETILGPARASASD